MPPPSKTPLNIPAHDLQTFTTHLQRSQRIIAVLGAGLSASSGLPTFRGAGGLWRSYEATHLATPGAFKADPGLVWQFYSYRRHMATNAKPNRAHYALAELARRKGDGFITLSQNVDGLSPRAGHPAPQLKLLHGSLFDVKCEDEVRCGYIRRDDFSDPICPALAIPQGGEAAIATESRARGTQAAMMERTAPLINGIDIANAEVPLPALPRSSLPHCPKCKTSLLRPGVVWFGELLPTSILSDIDAYFDEVSDSDAENESLKGTQLPSRDIDLCLVIGTSSQVYPAAGYAAAARSKGARVAIVNLDPPDALDLEEGDWFFQGDAAEIIPEILTSVIGEIRLPGET